ncbi:MAG: glycosyltransferase family 39 protein [gamma proteobacterium symbiont of Taylorina sp.]|nr:glycosyltransferase family 39 protein [gamma proteobacterium symbiont of Taylorina sp.]
MDDEWHSLAYVIDKSLFEIFTTFSYPPNTPLNLYYATLLDTVGWNEITLKLPSILTGIISLFIFPLLVKKQFNIRITLFFSWMLAISPFLIFYSRMARSYSPAVFFSFIAILCAYYWMTTNNKKHLLIYLFSSTMAVYFHLFSLIGIAIPIFIGLLIKLQQNIETTTKFTYKILPDIKMFLLTYVILLFLLCSLLLYPMIEFIQQDLHKFVNTSEISGKMSLVTIKETFYLISGSSHLLAVSLYSFLFIWGSISTFKNNTFFFILIYSIFLSYLFIISLLNLSGIQNPIVLTRYMIIVIPLSIILVSIGLDSLYKKIRDYPLPSSKWMAIIVCLACLLIFGLSSPILHTYHSPNNFTNHAAYQESYNPINLIRSYTSRVLAADFHTDWRKISNFYFQIKKQKNIDTIIEYPMFIGFHFNFNYYYQYFHKKRIIAGYITTLKNDEIPVKRNVNGYLLFGHVLSRINEKEKLKFNNMVDVSNINSVLNSGAQYIILHKNLASEFVPYVARLTPPAKTIELRNKYSQAPGLSLIYEDDFIVVFGINQ